MIDIINTAPLKASQSYCSAYEAKKISSLHNLQKNHLLKSLQMRAHCEPTFLIITNSSPKIEKSHLAECY